MTSAVILGMIVTMFQEPGEQAKAIGVYSFIVSAGAGLLTGLFALRLVRDDEALGLRSGADAPGAPLVTGALMLGVYTILEAGGHGWTSLHTLGFGAAALALLARLHRARVPHREPARAARDLRVAQHLGANAIQALMVAGLFGMFFMGVLYLQRVLGSTRSRPVWRSYRSRC
jgi:hypothetical protein